MYYTGCIKEKFTVMKSPLNSDFRNVVKTLYMYQLFSVFWYIYHHGPVVQSTISANPGLNFNLLFWFKHF